MRFQLPLLPPLCSSSSSLDVNPTAYIYVDKQSHMGMSILRMHTYIPICWPGSCLSLNGLLSVSLSLSLIQTQKLVYEHVCIKKLKLKCFKTQIEKSIFMLFFLYRCSLDVTFTDVALKFRPDTKFVVRVQLLPVDRMWLNASKTYFRPIFAQERNETKL